MKKKRYIFDLAIRQSGMNQEAVGKLIGVGRDRICKIVTAHQEPLPRQADILAEFFKMSKDELFKITEPLEYHIKMKNKYEIRGDVTAIYLYYKGETLETLIGTKHLERAREFPGTWWPKWCNELKDFYVQGDMPKVNGIRRRVMLHRWITDAPPDMVVDHINHLTLDNREENIRVVRHNENQQNKKGLQKNNKSGIRGVYWANSHQKWVADLKHKGKKVLYKLCDTKEEAAELVHACRLVYHPFSQEAMREAQ